MTGMVRCPTKRGPAMFNANSKRLESADKTRWACGRTVKAETSTPHIYKAMEVWTLKERHDGNVVVADRFCTYAEALAWVTK